MAPGLEAVQQRLSLSDEQLKGVVRKLPIVVVVVVVVVVAVVRWSTLTITPLSLEQLKGVVRKAAGP